MLNPFKDVNWNPSRAEKRNFAVSLMIGFPAIAIIFALAVWLKTSEWKPFFFWLGTVGFAAGAVLWLLPRIARPFYMVWYFLACCAGFFMSHLLLALVFFVVLTPIGLALRAFGRPPLAKGFDRQLPTYWRHASPRKNKEDYYRQF